MTVKLRPFRLAWQETDKFAISGVDSRGNFQRTVLRFSSPQQAELTASAIKGLGLIEEEPLTRPGEIIVKIMYEIPRFPKRLITIFLLTYFVPPFAILIALTIFHVASIIFLGALVLAWIVLHWATVLFIRLRFKPTYNNEPSQSRLTSPYKGWLLEKPETIQLRTGYGSINLNPTHLRWKDSSTLVLTTEQSRIHLEFITPEDATNAFHTLMQHFQRISQTATYHC